MATRADMIEVPARRIVDAILSLKKVKKAKVEIEKNGTPIDANFNKISVTIQGEN
jgi:dihydroneopterin aldolase